MGYYAKDSSNSEEEELDDPEDEVNKEPIKTNEDESEYAVNNITASLSKNEKETEGNTGNEQQERESKIQAPNEPSFIEDTKNEQRLSIETFKKVTRGEWNKMSVKEKKKYLREKKKWKLKNTVYIKDDSDNERITDDDDDDEDLEF